MRRLLIFLIWWITTCGTLFSIEAIGYRCVRLNILTEYNNTLYHNDALIFFLDSEDSFADLSEISDYASFDKCVILKYEYEEYGKNGMVFHGREALDFAYAETDHQTDSCYAIAGLESGYGIGSTVEYRHKEYRVECVLDEHINSLVNNGVFVYDDELSLLPTDCAYALTSSDRSVIKKAYEDMEKLCASKDISIRCLDIGETRYEDFIHFRSLFNILMAVFALFLAMVCFVHRLIWTRTRNKLNNILFMLGAEDIVLKDLFSYGSLIILSCFGSTIIYLEIYGRINAGKSFLWMIISGCIITFLILTCLVPCIKRNQ